MGRKKIVAISVAIPVIAALVALAVLLWGRSRDARWMEMARDARERAVPRLIAEHGGYAEELRMSEFGVQLLGEEEMRRELAREDWAEETLETWADAGLIVLDLSFSGEVWVEPTLWRRLSFHDKCYLTTSLALARKEKGYRKPAAIRICDNQTGKTLARWGLWGLTISG